MFSNLAGIDFTQIYTVLVTLTSILGGIGTVFAAFKAKDWKGAFKAFNDLMNPFIPQTTEQTQLVLSGKVSPETYRMTSDNVYNMWRELVAGRANITHDALARTIEGAECDGQVEYVIVTLDNDGRAETEPFYAFVSYGAYTVADKETIEKMSVDHGGVKKYYIGC